MDIASETLGSAGDAARYWLTTQSVGRTAREASGLAHTQRALSLPSTIRAMTVARTLLASTRVRRRGSCSVAADRLLLHTQTIPRRWERDSMSTVESTPNPVGCAPRASLIKRYLLEMKTLSTTRMDRMETMQAASA